MEGFLDAALSYAKRGWCVFPLVERDKTPAVSGGFTVATVDEEQIRMAWERRPGMNVAIATGAMSGGLLVIDLDVHPEKGEDGTDVLWAWEREHGELPETVTAKTGSGGVHLYYRCNVPVQCSVNPELGVDVRSDGGYVVAPPSVHPCGGRYEWDRGPDEAEVADADENVIAFVRHVQKQGRPKQAFRLPDVIKDGARNDTLMRYACSMHSRGDDDMLILAALEAANKLRCKPPLPQSEVESIVESVTSRYDKGGARSQTPAPAKVSLMMTYTKGGDAKPVQSIENCCRVLEQDTLLCGRLYYDSRAYTRMVTGPLPWNDEEGERAITDADYCGLAAYLERSYGLMQKQKAVDAVVYVASKNRRNLVAEWLDSLRWDGVPRMGTLLSAFLGAEPSDYNCSCMRLFMLGAVARAYEPGTKFDYIPVLVGAQGIGKSMFLRRLGTRSEWYCDNLNTIEGDAAAEKLRGMWIVEMAELLATKRSKDVEGIKAFVTSTVDTIRPKYARETEQRPRGCVFAGTTNDMQFLTDTTGNRRFLPIECGVHEPAMGLFSRGVEDYFEQAWAEAASVWKAERPALVLPKDLQKVAIEKQEQYLEDDPKVGMVQEYLDRKLAAERAKAMPVEENLRVCAQELIDNALPEVSKKGSPAQLTAQVHKIMQTRVEGWQRRPSKARCGAYGVQRCYVPEGMS